MKLRLENKMLLLFFALFIAISILGIIAYQANNTQKNSYYWIRHTQAVLYKSEQVLSIFKDLQIGMRGFFITKDSAFLKPFIDAKKIIFANLQELRNLSQDNILQQARVDTLIVLAKQQIDFSNSLIKAQLNNVFTNDMAITYSRRGKSYPDKLRTIVANLQKTENELLIKRQETNNQNIRQFHLLFYALLLSILILFIIFFLSIRYNLILRNQREQILNQYKENLEQEVRERTAKLIQSEEKFRALIENNFDAISLVDENSKIVYTSPSVERITGFSLEQNKSQSGFNFIHPDDVESIKDSLKNVINQPGKPIHFKARRLHSKGHYIWVEGVVTNLLQNESVKAIVSNYRDISERVKAEEELKKNHTFLQKLTDKLPIVIYQLEISLDGRMYFPFMSKSIEKILPTATAEQIIADASWGFKTVHPDDLENLLQSIEESRQNLSDWNVEYRSILNKGKVRWFKGFSQPERKTDGTVVWYGYLEDITQQKNIALQIEKSEKRYQILIERISDIFIAFDKNLCYTYINKKGCELLRHNATDLIGKYVWDVFPDAVGSTTYEAFNQAMKTQQYLSNEDYYAPLNLWQENHFYPSEDGLSLFIRDISERKIAENKLIESEKYFKSLIENISDGIVVNDKNSNLIYQSPSVTRILGYTEEERKGNPIRKYVHPTEEKDFSELFVAMKTKFGESIPFQYRFLHKSGQYIWLEGVMTNLLQDPSVKAIIANYRDITKRKELETRQALYVSIVNSSEDAIISKTLDGIITSWNRGAERIFDYTTQEIIGKNISILVPPERLNEEFEIIEKIKKGGYIEHYETQRLKKGGKLIYISLTVSPIKDENGEIVGASKIARDISGKKQAEEQIKIANERYDLAIKATNDAIWDWDIINDNLYWGEGFRSLFGYHLDSNPNSLDFWTNNVHSADSQRVLESLDEVLAQRDKLQWTQEYRFRMFNGLYAHVLDRGLLIRDKAGKPIRMIGAIQDISRQKAEEQHLRLLESVITNANDAVLITEAEPFGLPGPRIIYVNEAFTKMTGYTKEEVIGQTPRILQGPKTDKEALKKLRKALENWEPYEIELVNYKKNGEEFWINFSVVPVADDKGWFTHWIAIERDITNRKKAEEEIEFERQNREALINSTDDLIWSVDKDFKLIATNAAFTNLLKTSINVNLKTGDEILLTNHFSTEFIKIWENSYKRILIGRGKSFKREIYMPAEGEVNQTWFEVNFNPIYAGTKIVGVVCYGRNITKNKEYEQKLANERNLLRTLIDNLPDYIFVKDTQLRHIINNKANVELMGASSEDETLGKTVLDFFEPSIAQQYLADDQKVIQSGQAIINFEEQIINLNNETRWLMTSKIPLRNKNNTITGLVGISRDITKQKHNEKILKELNKQLEERAEELVASNNELEQFAYIASHDLQEPLRMVTSFLTQLEKKYKEQLDDKARQYIYFAVDGATRMRRIILDLLEYSRVGRKEIVFTEIDLNKLVKEVIELSQNIIEQNDARIILEELPTIHSAWVPLQHVFQNLISNAIKYQKTAVKPQIEIKAQEMPQHWQFSVSDNGIGIEQAFFDKIFLIFQRLHNRTEYSGTGVGLAICKKTIENLGGKIWVESIVSQGSTFYFTIPKK